MKKTRSRQPCPEPGIVLWGIVFSFFFLGVACPSSPAFSPNSASKPTFTCKNQQTKHIQKTQGKLKKSALLTSVRDSGWFFDFWFLVFVVVFHSLSVFFYRSLSMSIVYHLSCFRMFAFYYLLWKLFLLVFLSFSVFPSNGKWKVYSRCIRWYLKGTFKVYWN